MNEQEMKDDIEYATATLNFAMEKYYMLKGTLFCLHRKQDDVKKELTRIEELVNTIKSCVKSSEAADHIVIHEITNLEKLTEYLRKLSTRDPEHSDHQHQIRKKQLNRNHLLYGYAFRCLLGMLDIVIPEHSYKMPSHKNS